MAYFSGVTKFNALVEPSAIPFLQRLSLRSVKAIIAVFLLGTVCGFLMLGDRLTSSFGRYRGQETRWQDVLRTGITSTKTNIKTVAIPSMDQLPDIIEQCRGAFVKEGVAVLALNVERFGEQPKTADGASLDYGLVRLHLRGNWAGIVTSLKGLEATHDGNVHLQEVILNTQGGEALLRIYFSMGA